MSREEEDKYLEIINKLSEPKKSIAIAFMMGMDAANAQCNQKECA